MAEETFRTPSEMLMESLEDVEGAEKVIIIIQKEKTLRWDAADIKGNPTIDEVQLLVMKTLNAIQLEGFGLFQKEKD
jgi:hypothetical protein